MARTVVKNSLCEIEDVDAGWLTSALREADVLKTASVVGFAADAIGTGQVGHNMRYQLQYDSLEPEAPPSVVIKFPSPDESSRSTGILMSTYDKEARFYAQLAPTVNITIPRCFRVEHDEGSHLSTLMFEDLAPAEQGDQLEGCSPARAELAIDELVGLHVPYWNSPKLSEISWLNVSSDEGRATMGALYSMLWPGFVERFGERLSSEVMALGATFGENFITWSKRREQGPHTLTHSDFRLDNLLFSYDKDGLVTKVTTVDWQTVSLGVGTADLAYFLGAGLLTKDRRVSEKALVERYYTNLVNQGVKGYEWSDCWDDYRCYSMSGFFMAVIASMSVRADERGDAMFTAMAERHGQQGLDLEVGEFL